MSIPTSQRLEYNACLVDPHAKDKALTELIPTFSRVLAHRTQQAASAVAVGIMLCCGSLNHTPFPPAASLHIFVFLFSFPLLAHLLSYFYHWGRRRGVYMCHSTHVTVRGLCCLATKWIAEFRLKSSGCLPVKPSVWLCGPKCPPSHGVLCVGL